MLIRSLQSRFERKQGFDRETLRRFIVPSTTPFKRLIYGRIVRRGLLLNEVDNEVFRVVKQQIMPSDGKLSSDARIPTLVVMSSMESIIDLGYSYVNSEGLDVGLSLVIDELEIHAYAFTHYGKAGSKVIPYHLCDNGRLVGVSYETFRDRIYDYTDLIIYEKGGELC